MISAVVLLAVTEQRLKVKPGLWQIEQTMKYSGLPPQMQSMLDRLTPEQRKAMGVGGTLTRKQCVTEKQLNTSWVDGDQNCKWTILKSTESDLEVNGTACRAGTNQGWNSDVVVKIHVSDPEHLHGSMHGTATGQGIDATLDGSYKGDWVAEACAEKTK
jgi:hypothetical protein